MPMQNPVLYDSKNFTFKAVPDIAPGGVLSEALGYEAASGNVASHSELLGDRQIINSYEQINEGKLTLYYFGILKYDDAFGQHRRTNYCLYIADPKKKQIGICNVFNDIH